MNRKKCEACPHVRYDGASYRCDLITNDYYNGKKKPVSQVRVAECEKARADFAAGLYKTIDDDGFQSDAAEIIAKAQARYAAERKAKEEKKTCGECKHYPVNPIRNPARMEACELYKIAVREGGKACPDWEART